MGTARGRKLGAQRAKTGRGGTAQIESYEIGVFYKGDRTPIMEDFTEADVALTLSPPSAPSGRGGLRFALFVSILTRL